MIKKYHDKIHEVGEKFKSFLTELSDDIVHGLFFKELELKYSVNIGAGGKVEQNDLLGWIRGVALSSQSQAHALGFFPSVMHQPNRKSLVYEVEDGSSADSTEADELASFLSRDSYAHSSTTGSILVKNTLFLQHAVH